MFVYLLSKGDAKKMSDQVNEPRALSTISCKPVTKKMVQIKSEAGDETSAGENQVHGPDWVIAKSPEECLSSESTDQPLGLRIL